MWYGSKKKPTEPPKIVDFDEKAFTKASLPVWDARWQQLSREARRAYLFEIKGPAKQEAFSVPQTISAEKLTPTVLAELVEHQFISISPSTAKNKPARVMAQSEALDFAKRVRGIERYRLLQESKRGELSPYVDWRYNTYQLNQIVAEIVKANGLELSYPNDREVARYLLNHRWPGWVAKRGGNPLAESILQVILSSDKAVPRAALPGLLGPDVDPDAVRASVDALLAHLAIVEDLDAESFEIVVGFAGGIRKRILESRKPRERPPLEEVSALSEFGPDGGIFIDDLRAVLLETVAQEPRLKQSGELFVKEHDRYLSALVPIPGWLSESLAQSMTHRLTAAVARGRRLEMLEIHSPEKEPRLRVTREGETWLNSGGSAQYAEVFEPLQELDTLDQYGYGTADEIVLYTHDFGPNYYGREYDSNFLGSRVASFSLGKSKEMRPGLQLPVDDRKSLRACIGKALTQLHTGKFYTLESLLQHWSFGSENVVLRGREPHQISVSVGGAAVPNFDEEIAAAGRFLLDSIIRARLIPLGAMQAGVDAQGRLCVARTPRLGPYFGMGELADEPAVAAIGSKVVVQPDFSVVVIGLSTGPLADLAPFCERVTRGATPGAVQLKITRAAVIRAVEHGLTVEKILERLKTHANHALPPNIILEIKEWGGKVRRVSTEMIKVIRCPDRETADRVSTVLRKGVERINDTLLALDSTRLDKADRNKLREYGILVVETDKAEASRYETKKKTAQKTRSRRW